MKISKKDWNNYIARLRKINNKAAEKVADYMAKVDIGTAEGMTALLDYSYAVATRYGEAATELACQMYDTVAAVNKAAVPAAEPAATATYGEVAKAVRGKMFDTKEPSAVGSAVGRLVKMAGVDTTMQNALRDGAEWAWIPSGDTCAFCLTLASRGWQKASKAAIRGGHADHIHNNCDCTYAIRFDGVSDVEGYDPDALYDDYMNAADGSPQDKINALRRQHYATNKDRINAQKRANYQARKISRKSDVYREYMKDATPGIGKITRDDGYIKDKKHAEDEKFAQWVIDKIGGDVHLVKERRSQGLETADAFWKDAYLEFKKPTTENAIRKRVRKGTSQIAAMGNPEYGRMLIDISDRTVSREKMISAMLDEAPKRSKQKTLDLIVRENDEIVDIYRIKK